MELSDLYSQKILEIAANQPTPGRLARPDATVRKVSRVCGSSIEVDISGVQVGRKIRIANGVTLGRNPENTVCFSGPDGTLVSGKHAVIEKRD